ncbi:MAG: methyltransferase domain-containing protein, partial [Acidimicrobiales bacterium]
SRPLPLAAGSATKAVCHNVLGELADPPALVAETTRVLRPGGLSVWSYIDLESVVLSGGDAGLNRRVVLACADAGTSPGADGRMGRRLAAELLRSPLRRTAVDTAVFLSTSLSGPALMRVRTMFATLRDATPNGTGRPDVDELTTWRQGLEEADRAGQFLYAHTTYIVEAEKA